MKKFFCCYYFLIVLIKDYFSKTVVCLQNYFALFFQKLIIQYNPGSGPDPNWAKNLDPDLNSIYLDPQHWLYRYACLSTSFFMCSSCLGIFKNSTVILYVKFLLQVFIEPDRHPTGGRNNILCTMTIVLAHGAQK